MNVSECCGAEDTAVVSIDGPSWSDLGLCPACRDHCEFVDEDEEIGMSKHTPGPWRAVENFSQREPISIGSVEAGLLASVFSGYGADGSTTEANASLIAAAPDLLEALESVMDEAGRGKASIRALILHQIDAAITKAKGEA